VIPWDSNRKEVMDSDAALKTGYRDLARWLSEAEGLWKAHGRGGMTLRQRWDYNRAIGAHFPIPPVRVLFAASGTQPAAAKLVGDDRGIAEHKLYWSPCRSVAEADYLCAIMNSETARSRAEHWQSEGQWGKRDFDKAVFNLPIPEFNPKIDLHRELAAAAMHAEFVASRVEVKPDEYFVTTRNRIRRTLIDEGISGDIEKLVEKLLGPV